MTGRTAAVAAALQGGAALTASMIARRIGLPRPVVEAALALLAADEKIGRSLSGDDGFVLVVRSLARLRQRRPDRLDMPVAAERPEAR